MPRGIWWRQEFDAGRALVEADQAVAAAKSGSDLQGAVVKLNGVRAHYGEAPIDDVALASILETRRWGMSGPPFGRQSMTPGG